MSEEKAIKRRGRPKKTVENEAGVIAENIPVKPRRSRTTVKETLASTSRLAEVTRKRTTRKASSTEDAIEAETETPKNTATTKTKRTRKSTAKDIDNVPTTIAEQPKIDAVALDPATSNILSQAKAFSELRHIDDFVEQLERADEKSAIVSQSLLQTSEIVQSLAPDASSSITATQLQDRLDTIAFDILQTRADLIDHNLSESSVIVQNLRVSRGQVSSLSASQQEFKEAIEAHLSQRPRENHQVEDPISLETTLIVKPQPTTEQSAVISAGPLYSKLSATPPSASVDSTTVAEVIESTPVSQQLPSEQIEMTPLPSSRQTSSTISSSSPSSSASSSAPPKFQTSTSFPSRYLSTSTSTSQKPPRAPHSSSPSSTSSSRPSQTPQQQSQPRLPPSQHQQQQLRQSHKSEPQKPKPSDLTIKERRKNPKYRALELKWLGIIVGIPVIVMTSWELLKRYQKQQAQLQKKSRERGELTENMPGVQSSRNSGVNINGGV